MREVATWVSKNTDFDRTYIYGEDRPIHVSYSDSQSRQITNMKLTSNGKYIPSTTTDVV